MILIILLIIFFTLIGTQVTGGNENTYIHIVPLSESETQDTLLLGLANLYKLDITHNQRRVLNAYIFANNAENIICSFADTPDLTNINAQSEYYAQYVGDDFTEFKSKLISIQKWGVKTNNTEYSSIGMYKKIKLENRRKWGYNPPESVDYNTRLIYTLIDIVFKGDQWTVISDTEMQLMHKRGFLIECFGSPINTRSKYFGSMLKRDSVWGALGTCQEILHTLISNTNLMYKNNIIYNSQDIPRIFVSPPSGYELQLYILNLMLKLLQTRPAEIHFGMSSKVYKNINPDINIYIENCNYHLDMYEMVNNKIIFRKKLETDRGWYNCTFSSIEYFNFKKYLQKNTIPKTEFNTNTSCEIYIYNKPIPHNNFSYIFTGQEYIYPKPQTYIGELSNKLLTNTKLSDNPFNTPLIIKNINNYCVIDDSVLPGGTKQRALMWYVNDLFNGKKTDLIYAGPSSGVAQVAMGIISKHIGLKSYMFSSGKNTDLTARAEKYGVNIIPCGDLEDCQEQAKNFNIKNPNTFLLPFGLNDSIFTYYLVRALLAVKGNINPKRMWLVCGSGVLLRTLYYVFPQTYFLGVQVGKTIWPDEIDMCRTRIFVHPQKFAETAIELPPYNAVNNYDAKLWFFVKKYGEPGDYIWNVAG